MYRRMLVATGEHPWSSAAVGYGVALAAHTGAELCILTVLALPLLATMPDTGPCSTLVMESLEAQGRAGLSWVAAAAEHAGVLSPTVMLRWGNIPATIMGVADDADCDLIVVGRQVRPGWQRPLRGAIAKQVATAARRPVLVVPPPPASRWSCWSRALVVIDGSPSADVALEYALTLAQAAPLDVCLLHVPAAWPPGVVRHARASAPEACTLAAAQALAAGVRYDVQGAAGRGVTAILETATHRQCDLILLGVPAGTRWQRLWCGRTVRALTTTTPVPVLLVPAGWAGGLL